jgi:hypothetical protein
MKYNFGDTFIYVPEDPQKADLSFEFQIFGENDTTFDIIVHEQGPRLYKIKKSEMKYARKKTQTQTQTQTQTTKRIQNEN